jgi:rSAM/selenodomain-associated transferase 1
MSVTVLVVAKAPLPGRAKTRLVPPLSAEQAADLQRALLLDTLDSCRAEGLDPAVLCVGEEAAALREAIGPGTRLVAQEGRGLADALRLGMRRHLEHGPVAMVSSDVPGLPPGSLGDAFAALVDGADVVLGPARDGGYWLVAMREPHDAPFQDIPLSTGAAYETTCRRCAEADLTLATVEPWRDVDTAVDVAALLSTADVLPAPHTRALLRGLEAAGTVVADEAPILISSEILTSSPWRSVLADRLANGDGRTTGYTYLDVPRAVFIVPATDCDEIALVRQYRHPVRDWTLEVPAGSVAPGETPLDAARRELAEEVGGRAREWRHLSSFYSSSAHIGLRSDAFLATGVVLQPPVRDEEEAMSVVLLPWAEAVERARRGAWAEGQTALAILLAATAQVRT